jgi:hypothetical protein
MSNPRPVNRFLYMAATALILASCLILPGCSVGFLRLLPEVGADLYGKFVQDIADAHGPPYWVWVRGSVGGDFNGDRRVEGKALVVTVQGGTAKRPGPIEAAYLIILAAKDGEPHRLIAKTELFSRNPIAGSPRPGNSIDWVVEAPLTQVRAQAIFDKLTFREAVAVYFWGESLPGSVWYAGYSLDRDGRLRKILETALWQDSPGLLPVNLDKKVGADQKGNQLVFPVSGLPAKIAARLDRPGGKPLWGHIYASGDDGVYRQADRQFSRHYQAIADKWNQAYLKAMLLDRLPPEELAWFEYRLGLLNFHTGHPELAAEFLERAQRGNRDGDLAKAIQNGKEYIK